MKCNYFNSRYMCSNCLYITNINYHLHNIQFNNHLDTSYENLYTILKDTKLSKMHYKKNIEVSIISKYSINLYSCTQISNFHLLQCNFKGIELHMNFNRIIYQKYMNCSYFNSQCMIYNCLNIANINYHLHNIQFNKHLDTSYQNLYIILVNIKLSTIHYN